MQKETLEQWLLDLDSMIAKLMKANRLGRLSPQEQRALGLLKAAVVSFESVIEEQEMALAAGETARARQVGEALRNDHLRNMT